jgi:hypothetical protein
VARSANDAQRESIALPCPRVHLTMKCAPRSILSGRFYILVVASSHTLLTPVLTHARRADVNRRLNCGAVGLMGVQAGQTESMR